MGSASRLIPSLIVGVLVLTAPLLAERVPSQPSMEESVGIREVLSPAWEIGAQDDLAAREYWITWQESIQLDDVPAAWHAPNRRQGLRTYFTPEGTRVVPRTSDQPAWEWGLSLVGYGRGHASRAVEQARLFPNENHIRFDHYEIDEWFVNEPQGIKHGFVLHEPPDESPAPVDSASPIHLDLMVSGTLIPHLGADGRSVLFASSPGLAVIYYRGLEVHDALGRSLPAWMETHAASGVWTILLLVDDRDAVYPVTIDPLATTASWIGEVDQDQAWFGIFVRTAGDVNADNYDDVIVGALGYDNGQEDEGAAFLYFGASEGLSSTYGWMVEGEETDAFAGRSVGTAGDVNGDGYDDVIVGVPRLDSGNGAWVFHGSPSGPSSTPDWIGQGGSGDRYGYRVGTAGDVNGDGYDDVIVGAYLGGQNQEGKAYVYHGSRLGLFYGAAWTAEGNQGGANFGFSVGMAGDVNGDGFGDVVVGANRFSNGEPFEGRAFVYYGSASGLSTQPDWTYENNDEEACLGCSVGTAGDVDNDGYDDVIIGAAYKQCINYPASLVGKAYVFHGSASGLPSTATWIKEMTQTGALFGRNVSTAGDVNSDGYDDVIVGAPYFDNEQTDEGAAYLFLGSEVGLSEDHVWMTESDQVDARLGKVGTAGDVNGDGVSDVIIGAYKYDNGEVDEGAAFLYLGLADVSAGWVPADTPLLLAKADGGKIHLSWGSSCLASDVDYEVYQGFLGDFAVHNSLTCSTGGLTEVTISPNLGSRYYLVVPTSTTSEGSYGTRSDGTERPPGTPACLPQAIGECY
jgi:hypothetical protein